MKTITRNTSPVGDELRSFFDRNQLCEYWNELKSLLNKWDLFVRKRWNEMKASEKIEDAYFSFGDCLALSQTPSPAILHCCFQTIRWLKKMAEQEIHTGRFLFDFYHDFAELKFSTPFCTEFSPRETRQSSSRHYKDAIHFAFKGSFAYGLTNETLAVFALRQCLENRFKTILGVKRVPDGIHFKMEVLSNVVIQNLEKMITAERGTMTKADVSKIYHWANESVHSASKTNAWLLWTAYDRCRFLFSTTDDIWRVLMQSPLVDGFGPGLQECPENGAITITKALLVSMRNEFVLKLSSQTLPKDRLIEWEEPEANIIDNEKQFFISILLRSLTYKAAEEN